MVAFGSKGFLNSTLVGACLIGRPLEIMYTEVAVCDRHHPVNLPSWCWTLQSVIEGIDRNVEEAAFSLARRR